MKTIEELDKYKKKINSPKYLERAVDYIANVCTDYYMDISKKEKTRNLCKKVFSNRDV